MYESLNDIICDLLWFGLVVKSSVTKTRCKRCWGFCISVLESFPSLRKCFWNSDMPQKHNNVSQSRHPRFSKCWETNSTAFRWVCELWWSWQSRAACVNQNTEMLWSDCSSSMCERYEALAKILPVVGNIQLKFGNCTVLWLQKPPWCSVVPLYPHG